jgi:phthalate 4,5-dioxygenase oxygenase subunit
MQITPELNERLTRVGPGTAMGEVFRRYWQPALLSNEVPTPDCPPVRVRLLCEDLVAFRDSNGVVGLVDAFCAHRRAPLFFGRNEERGLRCVYHGWKFDTGGNCVDLPSEPPQSRMSEHVRINSYPTFEAGGIIFTYMGPADQMPAPPDYEWLRAPAEYVHVNKTGQHSNYLQAVEGGIDTAHISFLHNNDIQNPQQINLVDKHPRLDVDKSEFGFTYAGLRKISDEATYVRAYRFIMPNQTMLAGALVNFTGKDYSGLGVGGNPNQVQGHIWVPIDDENTWNYNRWYRINEGDPFDPEGVKRLDHTSGRGPEDIIPGTLWPKYNFENDYMIDREVQRAKTFTGIAGIGTQDLAMQERMAGGAIVDRSKENLGSTDTAVLMLRDILLECADAVEQGKAPLGVDPGPAAYVRSGTAIIATDTDWRDIMKEVLAATW